MNQTEPANARLAPPPGVSAGAATQRSLLRMSAGGELVAVPIESVREILEVGRLTPLPRTPDFVRGVMNLRGAVVPVVDLSARIEHGCTVVGRRSCIVVVEAGHPEGEGSERSDSAAAHGPALVAGLLVDAVFEVFDATLDQVEAVPMFGTRIHPHYLAAMARARGEVISVLELARLLSVHELADAIAAHQPA